MDGAGAASAGLESPAGSGRPAHFRVAIEFNAELSIPIAGRATERVKVKMELAKRRYVYVANELVLPVDPDVGMLPYGVQSTRRSRVAIENPSEPIRHDNVSLGHSVLWDVHRTRSASERFPVLSQVDFGRGIDTPGAIIYFRRWPWG